jgi:hypothetical protein
MCYVDSVPMNPEIIVELIQRIPIKIVDLWHIINPKPQIQHYDENRY